MEWQTRKRANEQKRINAKAEKGKGEKGIREKGNTRTIKTKYGNKDERDPRLNRARR